MKEKNKVVSFCSAAVLALVAAILVYLFAVSMLETVDMNMNNRMLEHVETHADRLWFNFLTLALLTTAAFLWKLLTDRLPPMLPVAFCTAAVVLSGVISVLSSQSAPTHDSLIVSRTAYQAAMGDGAGLASAYFVRFPFQLGYVFFGELVIRMFRTGENYLIMEIINVFCLAATDLALMLMVRKISGTGKGQVSPEVNFCAFLMLIFLPPVLFCSFTYGNLPGLMCAVLAVWQVLCILPGVPLFRWSRQDRESVIRMKKNLVHAVLAALCIGCGVALKKNMMIIFTAIVILLIFRLIRKPSAVDLLCLVLCGIAVWGIPAGIQAQYEQRFGLDFGKGIPMSSWAAMGLNDSEIAPGWYNAQYTVVNFMQSGNDPAEAGKRSAEVIRTRLEDFRKDPAGALHFFTEKINSEWNEPTYQSIWTNQVRGQYGEKGWLAAWICGDGEPVVKGWMNAVVQFIFLVSAIGCITLLRRRRIEDAFFAVCIFGGFLYHAIFEAKSQYIITYMLLLLPLAAVGMCIWKKKSQDSGTDAENKSFPQ